MSTFEPLVVVPWAILSDSPPAAPLGCAGRLRELARLEWRLGQRGDPFDLAEQFIAAHGMSVGDVSSLRPHASHLPVCGAAVLVSAGACAAAVGGRPGPPSPAPAVPDLSIIVYAHGPPAPPRRPGAGFRLGGWEPSWPVWAHAAAVSSVRDAIAAGDVYQVNLVGHASAPYRGDPVPALRRVAGLAGARYGGVLGGTGWAVACASPETLLTIRNGRAVTRPIKGTRPATAAGRAELLASTKERAEHIMIVDLERNDLARVAATGTVRVDELYRVRRWCDLWQAESVVSARLRDGVGLAQVLRALCPGGSVTGAPKLAALDVVAALEPVGRGPSMGVAGWVGAGRLDLGLTIRTVAVDADRVHVWAGGGITWGSDPAGEVAEAAAKAAPLRAALAGR
jgi:para-aminobenzoate synthetase component 1